MTELLPITGGEPNRDEPQPEASPDWTSDQQLDEDGAWAADQLRAYQLAFRFIDEEDAAAVGELARFSLSPEALACAFTTIVLPGMKFPGKRKSKSAQEAPAFTLTVAPERVRVTGKVGSLIAETSVPLVRRSAVRSTGITLALDPSHLGSVFGRRGRRIDWHKDETARFTFTPPLPDQNRGTLTLDVKRAHLFYDAHEVSTEPPLPTLDTLPEIPVDAARALARGLTQAANLPPNLHIGVIVVKDGVALGASTRHIIEYREPGLGHFNFAVSLTDARPLRSMLMRLGAPLRQWKVKDRLLLSDGVTSCSIAVSERKIASFEGARDNAMAGVKVTLSVAQFCEAITKIGALTRSGKQMVRFVVRHDEGSPSLYLTSQVPSGKGQVFVTSLAHFPDIELPEDCYLDLVGLYHAVQPTKFDAAEICLGSHAAMIVQYRGEASLTQVLAYRTAEG